MRALLLSLLLILSFPLQAQLDSLTIDKILMDLHDYDDLKVKYNTADSTITVLRSELGKRDTTIAMCKGSKEEYERAITILERDNDIADVKHQVTKQKLRKARATSILLVIVDIVVVVLVLAL